MFRIFGPPGTGKTTTLLNMVEKAMEQGVSPQRIGFFAFTRKAATEAKERAAKRFNLDPEVDLPHFRTLHSLAYRTLSVKEHQVMGKENFKELSEAIGFQLSGAAVTEESGSFKSSDHPILQVINLARAKRVPLREEYNRSTINFSWAQVDYIAKSYSNYKEAHGVLDFHDMLELFIQESDYLLPEFDLCFLDEAQDLSPVQWEIARKLDKRSKRMYVAGDDDQAIFVWSGADVDQFIGLTGDAEILDQSYRIPSAVHELAESISSRIKNRFPKTYKPRAERGKVERIRNIENLDMSEGSWLILAQANHMLWSLYEGLKQNGYLFEKPDGYRSIPEKMSIAINGWEQLRKGRSIPVEWAQCIYSYMSGNNIRIQRGHKNIKAVEGTLLTLEDLQKHHGLLATDCLIWHEAMDKIPELDKSYVKALLRSGEKFNAVPRIRLSTIHGAKGGEAENVVLITDLTAAAMDQLGDDLHRVFYVGVTRALENLYIVEPEDYFRAYPI